MDFLGVPLGAILRLCYQPVQNYGLAIILFTIVTKVLLFPVSLWVHRNGIKMVRIQPDINRLKIKYYGDMDKIADEQAAIFKKEKYSPFSSSVPIIVQLVLLIGLIQVIYHPLRYILNIPEERIAGVVLAAQQAGVMAAHVASPELAVLDMIQNTPAASFFQALMTPAQYAAAAGMNMDFLGLRLSGLPLSGGGQLWLIPILAALAAVVLSLSQNRLNPLQKQQGKVGQLSSMAFSVGISLILGFTVPAGVGFYWIWSNLFTILQQLILNRVYAPKKHIDYAALEASQKELASYHQVGGQSKAAQKLYASREKADYKRFFAIANKHIVFYSESSGFYKYFAGVIGYLLEHSKLTIHYVTSDPKDQVFELFEKEPRIKAYYIGEKKLITLLLKVEADIMVMTMSDLNNYHYKRSYMSKTMEYVYMFHYPLSTHMVLHTGALNHYDTILCVGEFQFDEIRKTEEIYGLRPKKLIACGYGQLESLYEEYHYTPHIRRERPKLLIAPSWQEDNILDSCLDTLLAQLIDKHFDIVVRPHPEYVKRYGARMDDIIRRWQSHMSNGLSFETDFTSNASLFDSDVVITDWSGAAYEFSLVTERPCVFIDTLPKIHNPEYANLGIAPLEFLLRDQIGLRVDPQKMDGLADQISELLRDNSRKDTIAAIRSQYIANFGRSAQVAGEYLIQSICEHIDNRSEH